ncbi:M61 family metallopeptidase [Granulicella tundricola]|uniref:Peptidase M61 domain protein n=1 Tax=Granulicella tundricola (strain ATCC BAA-1859 / DSM 23138 / MP5ACTX9) TaxID=1198114 RepID=E8X2B6_GRATM|nr:M61 family metallopeptidase [Granulicella tundricola]ADW68048.1 peptidase M61 domain protein [Granulicella tundricola MP5ACTX9]
MQKLVPCLLAATLFTSAACAQKTPIRITADLTEAPRKLYHAEIDLPVKAGAITLITPQWIPGNHAPTGPASQIVGVIFTAAGKDGQIKQLPWRRDDVNLYEFHLEIPAGVTSLHAHLDAIVDSRVSRQMACLEWERLMLYPAHIPVKDIAIEPSVTVPAGWGIGTALTPVGAPTPPPPTTGIMESAHTPLPGSTTTHYAPTDVEQLLDSPVIAGKYFHEFPLAPEVSPKHYIDVVSDKPEDSNLRPELLAEISNLVREATTAYASSHYNAYHFLLTLSDVAGGEGLEHGQSSDNGIGEKGFSDESHQAVEADLLAHEFTHSWDGKYRRPVELYQKDFATPQQGQLLWVYEGMTQYMGNVLAARSGLRNQEQYRDFLAMSASSLDLESGRNWRSTEDTSIASSIDRHPTLWGNWERGQAYYQEGELMWLDADTLIREKTGGKKSLTDLQRIFLGKGGNTGPLIVTYDRKELIADLNQVLPYDWATFLHERIDLPTPHTDLAGIERGGYKLVYTDKPNASERNAARVYPQYFGGADAWASLGLRAGTSGTISDVRYDGPADKAMLSPGMKIIAVNGQAYSGDAVRQALDDTKGNDKPIRLILQQESAISTAEISYHEGQKYPTLQRIDGTPALMDEITKPLSPATVLPAPKAGKKSEE